MPEIIYDGKKVSVPAGTNLVDAAEQAGIHVPVFCYHKELGAVGSCRVCAVTVQQNGKSRMVMGCMTQAQDGMEVTTTDSQSVRMRKYVLEWLMENHPHDCPICDEGGECQLQDLTIASGHGIRRYKPKKRTFQNQHLGEFIVHEMNRCITCYRCQRFYQEYAGGRDFSATGGRNRVYFGRFEDGPLESPFSGNLVELCPTGVFTDKLFRYKSRVWDLEIAHSVCPHCSVGCNVHAGARHRSLQRVRMSENPAVNGTFLCDRGQFGHGFVMDPVRPRTIRAGGHEANWEGALGLAGGDLLRIARANGAASVALVASSRASLETHAALDALAEGPLEGARVAHFDDPEREARARAALAALARAGAAPLDQGDIAHCDVLLVAGTSLVDEAPLAALAARQVARRGGRLFVMNAGERYLGDVGRVSAVHPAALASELEGAARAIGAPGGAGFGAEVAAALAGAERPGILVGSDLVDGPAIAAAADLAAKLAGSGKAVRLGYLFPGPNGFGAAALSKAASLDGILADLQAGKLKAAVLVECDLAQWSEAARAALAKLESLVVLDYLPGPLDEKAQVFLPTDVTYESHGIFVNRAGRAQAFAPARVPGRSVIELIDHARFPRQVRKAPPEGDARPAWWVIEALRERALGGVEARDLAALRGAIQRSHAFWQPLHGLAAGSEGAPLDPKALAPERTDVPAFAKADGPAVFRHDRTLGSEVLSRRSAPIRKMAGDPVARLAPADASKLGVNGRVAIEVNGSAVELAALADEDVPAGVVLVPRDIVWPGRVAQGTAARVRSAATQEVRS